MARRRVNRDDVAERAGVSGTTVSFVLNGKSAQMNIPARTAERVHRAAAELGYVPNRAAQELRGGQTGRLGLVLWLSQRPVYTRVLEAMNRAAHDQGFSLLLALREREEPLADHLLPCLQQTDGAVVFAGALWDHDVESLSTVEKPVVVVNHWPLTAVATMVSDSSQMVEVATRHLLEQGYEDVHLASETEIYVDGFRRALQAAGLPFSPEMVCPSGLSYEAGRLLLDRLPPRWDARTGVVTVSDNVAVGYMGAAERGGWQAGRDYGIIGLHNNEVGEYLAVPLSTVMRPYDAIADATVALVREHRGQATWRGLQACFEPELVVRESSLRRPEA